VCNWLFFFKKKEKETEFPRKEKRPVYGYYWLENSYERMLYSIIIKKLFSPNGSWEKNLSYSSISFHFRDMNYSIKEKNEWTNIYFFKEKYVFLDFKSDS